MNDGQVTNKYFHVIKIKKKILVFIQIYRIKFINRIDLNIITVIVFGKGNTNIKVKNATKEVLVRMYFFVFVCIII